MAVQVDLRQLAVDRPGSAAPPLARKTELAPEMGPAAGDHLGLCCPGGLVGARPLAAGQAGHGRARDLDQSRGPGRRDTPVPGRGLDRAASYRGDGIGTGRGSCRATARRRGPRSPKLASRLPRSLMPTHASPSGKRKRLNNCGLPNEIPFRPRSRLHEQNVEHPVHLEAALAEVDAILAELNTEIKNLPFTLKAAQSRLDLARQDLEGKKSVGDALARRVIQKAQSEFDSADAAVEALRERAPSLEIQREACSRRCDALRTKLSLKTDEKRALRGGPCKPRRRRSKAARRHALPWNR